MGGRSQDAAAIRVFAGIAARIGKLLPVFFVGGAIFGLLAAATGQLNFCQPWLIGAYIVFVVAMVTGGAITGPWAGRMALVAAASGTDRPSSELVATMHERRAAVGSLVLMSAIVVIIFLMVFKPAA